MKTKLPPLPKVGERRLLKLIEFLEKLPRKNFDFNAVREERECGTVGCAIGWTPEVFPALVKPSGTSVEAKDESLVIYGFAAVAALLFGIHPDDAGMLFSPGNQKDVHRSLPTCGVRSKPEKVAAMLRKYLASTKEPTK